MEYKDNNDDLGEDQQDAVSLSRIGHIEEDAEDIEWQKRNDDAADNARHDVLELGKHILHRARFLIGNAQACHKREHKRTHHIEHGGYLEFEERFQVFHLAHTHLPRICHHRREEQFSRSVAQQTSKNGIGKGQPHRDEQQLACPMTDIGDSWCHQPQDDERYHEPKKLAENTIKRKPQIRNSPW